MYQFLNVTKSKLLYPVMKECFGIISYVSSKLIHFGRYLYLYSKSNNFFVIDDILLLLKSHHIYLMRFHPLYYFETDDKADITMLNNNKTNV